MEVLEYIKDFMKKNGYTPTLTEIGEGVGLESKATVHDHFESLVKKGYITKYGKRYSVKGMHYVYTGLDEKDTERLDRIFRTPKNI